MRSAARVGVALGVGVLVAALAACGEKAQTAGTAKKADTQAFEGAQTPYAAAGWKAGDRVSWEEQMRARAQNQNEYTRTK